MAATARLEFRLTPEDKSQIERAAELAGEPVTAFARTATAERADRVLREHETETVVPAEFFIELMVALDEPPRVNPALAAAAKRRRKIIVSD